jgi:hypothetical protein
MDDFLLQQFKDQAELQCKFLLHAAEEVDKAIEAGNVTGVFCALQNLINAGANISKVLWGAGGKLSAERQPVRDSLGVDDTSPLKNVNMRNNFEHFDERISRWWRESKRHNAVDNNLGRIDGVEDIDRFRNYDPNTSDLSFWGQDFNIKTLVDATKTLLAKINSDS